MTLTSDLLITFMYVRVCTDKQIRTSSTLVQTGRECECGSPSTGIHSIVPSLGRYLTFMTVVQCLTICVSDPCNDDTDMPVFISCMGVIRGIKIIMLICRYVDV